MLKRVSKCTLNSIFIFFSLNRNSAAEVSICNSFFTWNLCFKVACPPCSSPLLLLESLFFFSRLGFPRFICSSFAIYHALVFDMTMRVVRMEKQPRALNRCVPTLILYAFRCFRT